MPAATDADAAIEMLGDSVRVVLDGGPVSGTASSTIVAATGERPRLLRAGAIPTDELRTFLAGHGAELDTGDDELPEGGGAADSA